MRTRVADEAATDRSNGIAPAEPAAPDAGAAAPGPAAALLAGASSGVRVEVEDRFAARCAAKLRHPYIPPATRPASNIRNPTTIAIGIQIGGRGILFS
jgi:hypothetical protein